MAVKKLSIALDGDVARAASAAAEGQGQSLSSWLNDAAKHALAIQEGLAAVEEWKAENGVEFTEEEIAAADAILDRYGVGRPRRPRRTS